MNEKNHESILNRYSKSGTPVKDLYRFTSLCAELGISAELLKNEMKFVHIAGTNGKGSVSEYISNALSKSGMSTGKFTSPYIYRINERIQINNEPINGRDLTFYIRLADEAAERCKKSLKGISEFSQFELLTAAAFLYFADKKCGYAVIETGIGGLLDCTNIITPDISVITGIDYDHADILGHTLPEIAAHKAGIIKHNIPCVLYPEQDAETMRIIKEKTTETNSKLIIPEIKEIIIENCSVFGNCFRYKNTDYSTKMGGKHQILNAVTAIEALRLSGVRETFIKSALAEASIPARLQVLRNNPAVVIDGAHNPQGMRACRVALTGVSPKKVLLIGMMKNKDYRAALKEILPLGDEIVFCDSFSENAVGCLELYNTAAFLSFPVERIHTVSDCMEAFVLAEKLARDKSELLLITGSLYLAGFILKLSADSFNNRKYTVR